MVGCPSTAALIHFPSWAAGTKTQVISILCAPSIACRGNSRALCFFNRLLWFMACAKRLASRENCTGGFATSCTALRLVLSMRFMALIPAVFTARCIMLHQLLSCFNQVLLSHEECTGGSAVSCTNSYVPSWPLYETWVLFYIANCNLHVCKHSRLFCSPCDASHCSSLFPLFLSDRRLRLKVLQPFHSFSITKVHSKCQHRRINNCMSEIKNGKRALSVAEQQFGLRGSNETRNEKRLSKILF